MSGLQITLWEKIGFNILAWAAVIAGLTAFFRALTGNFIKYYTAFRDKELEGIYPLWRSGIKGTDSITLVRDSSGLYLGIANYGDYLDFCAFYGQYKAKKAGLFFKCLAKTIKNFSLAFLMYRPGRAIKSFFKALLGSSFLSVMVGHIFLIGLYSFFSLVFYGPANFADLITKSFIFFYSGLIIFRFLFDGPVLLKGLLPGQNAEKSLVLMGFVLFLSSLAFVYSSPNIGLSNIDSLFSHHLMRIFFMCAAFLLLYMRIAKIELSRRGATELFMTLPYLTGLVFLAFYPLQMLWNTITGTNGFIIFVRTTGFSSGIVNSLLNIYSNLSSGIVFNGLRILLFCSIIDRTLRLVPIFSKTLKKVVLLFVNEISALVVKAACALAQIFRELFTCIKELGMIFYETLVYIPGLIINIFMGIINILMGLINKAALFAKLFCSGLVRIISLPFEMLKIISKKGITGIIKDIYFSFVDYLFALFLKIFGD